MTLTTRDEFADKTRVMEGTAIDNNAQIRQKISSIDNKLLKIEGMLDMV